MFFFFENLDFLFRRGFCVLIFTVFFYNLMLLLFFNTLLVFNGGGLNFLVDLGLVSINFFRFCLFFFFVNMAGLPPLSGFVTKIILFNVILHSMYGFMYFVFFFCNIFIIFFYLQNVRYLIVNNGKDPFCFFRYHNYLSFNNFFISLFFLVVFVFFIFFSNDFLVNFFLISIIFF